MSTISRRGLARGAAWAAPAVFVASAAPATAASAAPCGTIVVTAADGVVTISASGTCNIVSMTLELALEVDAWDQDLPGGARITLTDVTTSATMGASTHCFNLMCPRSVETYDVAGLPASTSEARYTFTTEAWGCSGTAWVSFTAVDENGQSSWAGDRVFVSG
jgi:hypothetical protein